VECFDLNKTCPQRSIDRGTTMTCGLNGVGGIIERKLALFFSPTGCNRDVELSASYPEQCPPLFHAISRCLNCFICIWGKYLFCWQCHMTAM